MKSNASFSIHSFSTSEIDFRIILVVISFILFFSLNSNAKAAESIMLDDCNQYEEFCLGINQEDFNQYKVLVNGQIFEGDFMNCNYIVEQNVARGEGLSIRLGVGEYVVETVNTSTGEKNTKEVSITCAESKNEALNRNWIGEATSNELIIELDEIEISNYELFVDGENVTEDLRPNEEKSITVFKLAPVQGKKFFVYEWNLEGKEITGAFNSGQELVNLMNKMSDSKWSWDEQRGLLFGGTQGTEYDAMVISQLGDEGTMNSFPSVSVNIIGNLSLELPEGNHTIQVKNFTTGNVQTKEVVITNAVASK